MNFIKNILIRNSEWKVKSILPHLKKGERILDYGCGDFSFAKSLKKEIPTLKITGVDVVDFPNKSKTFPFYIYDGKTLPFKNNTFDTVISFYVFHHTDNAKKAFSECLRVAKRVLFAESVIRKDWEIPFMKLTDYAYNKWKSEDIPFTYQFLSVKDWENVFKKEKVKRKSKFQIRPSLPILSFGEQTLFDVSK